VIRRGIRRALNLALRRRDRWERDVEEEIKLHLILRAEQLASHGRAPDEAYAEAVRRFGPSLTQSRARLIEAATRREKAMHQSEILDDLRHDLSFAFRTLARQKAWTVVTVLTLGLGIGATTSVFSVVSTMLIHRLPYPHGERVTIITQQPTGGNNTGMSVSIMPQVNAIRGWQRDARSFESIQAMSIVPRSLRTATGDDSRASTAAITPGFFDFAEVRPLRGRIFTPSEVTADSRVALLAEGFWRARLGADPSVLGKRITLSDTSYTVIGIMPGTFRVTAPGRTATDVWLPLNLNAKDVRVSGVVGRLRPGANPIVAQQELDSIFARVAGFTNGATIPFKAVVAKPSEGVSFRDSLFLLMGAVGLLLLVACTNVAHLLLARTAGRQREIAIRTALGAARGRLFRQLLTESFLLCVGGTFAGLALGWLGVKALVAMRPSNQNDLVATHIDVTTLEVALGVTLLSALVFGVIGILESRRHSTNDTLKAGALAISASRGHRRARTLLVVSEIALSMMLVVGAGLVIHSLRRLQQTDVGFDPKNLYMITPSWRAHDSAANIQSTAEMFARVKVLPGVRAASIADVAPGTSNFTIGRLEIDGEPPPAQGSSSFVSVNSVQPNYFTTMGMTFVEGAAFADTTNAHAVIVNDLFARKHWARGQALGKRLRIVQRANQEWLTVVGVTHDAMTNGPTAAADGPMFYFARTVNSDGIIVARTAGTGSIFNAIVAQRPERGFSAPNVQAVSDFLTQSISEPRFVMLVMTAFGLVGLLLASIGLYGVMAYTVAQESRDIGVRIALGASRGHVMRAVITRGTALALTGVIVGLAGALWGTKLVEHHLFGIERLDPASFVGGAVVLIGAALLACIVPTRRALAVDPISAIRAD
jgi:putative ABC transport system permease protein